MGKRKKPETRGLSIIRNMFHFYRSISVVKFILLGIYLALLGAVMGKFINITGNEVIFGLYAGIATVLLSRIIIRSHRKKGPRKIDFVEPSDVAIEKEDHLGIIRNLISSSKRTLEISIDLTKSSRTGVVWLVAISGYITFNGTEYWTNIIGADFFGSNIWNYGLFYVPLLITALLGILSHFSFNQLIGHQYLYWKNYINALEYNYLFSDREYAYHVVNLIRIYTDSIEELDILKKTTSGRDIGAKNTLDELIDDRKQLLEASKYSSELENTTIAVFYMGFVWTLVGPFLLTLTK